MISSRRVASGNRKSDQLQGFNMLPEGLTDREYLGWALLYLKS